MASEPAKAARQLLRRTSCGVLSTHGLDPAGYPFGSVTPYALDDGGTPLILISKLAIHTRNIQANARVSVTVFDPAVVDPQAAERLTWIGDAVPVDAADTRARDRYARYLPRARGHFAMPDFHLYRLVGQRARFIAGFGGIHWIEPSQIATRNPLLEFEPEILEHMNRDHGAMLRQACQVLRKISTEAIAMVGIDPEGFDCLADDRLVRFELDGTVTTPEAVRAAMKTFAQKMRQSGEAGATGATGTTGTTGATGARGG